MLSILQMQESVVSFTTIIFILLFLLELTLCRCSKKSSQWQGQDPRTGKTFWWWRKGLASNYRNKASKRWPKTVSQNVRELIDKLNAICYAKSSPTINRYKWKHLQEILEFTFIRNFSELPNCCVAEPRDVCLIVKDLEKGLKVDHESTLNHFNELLASKGVDNITQIISLRELKVEYKQYEAKNSLCQKFDVFLVDERILRLVPKFLGKPFYVKKR